MDRPRWLQPPRQEAERRPSLSAATIPVVTRQASGVFEATAFFYFFPVPLDNFDRIDYALEYMTELTNAQKRILDFIQGEVQAFRPVPTFREICTRFGFRSPRAATCHVEAIKRKGYLSSQPGKARTLRLTSPLIKLRSRVADIPLYGSIPAGFAQNREQEAEGCVSVDVASIGFKPTRNTFALRVTGDSMIGRHVLSSDIVVLEHGPDPRHGEMVAALIDGESTLKTFVRKGGKSYLKAENPKYPDLLPAHELMIQGVFKALIRKTKE